MKLYLTAIVTIAIVLAVAFAADGPRPSASRQPELPQQGGLPINVQTGLFFLKIDSVQENENTFRATVDLRLRWKDSSAPATSDTAITGFQDFIGDAAKAKLGEVWVPDVEFSNMEGEPTYATQVLRVFKDGRVEFRKRVTGTFSSEFSPDNFPFDHQKLRVKLVVRGEDAKRVALDFRQEDLDFSHVSSEVEVSGWDLGLVDIHRESERGLFGEYHSGLSVELETIRQINTSLAPIFIPLFASLLIPLMAIYLNKVEDGDFQIDAFELCNIVIGGLFAVIALNFTVNSTYQSLGGTDNPVTRLFSLNYLGLGIALAIIICMFHFNMVKRMCGKYVQEQLYVYMIWAGPLLLLATAVAILLAAAA
ncbi:MAG: hypothetical protein ACAI35_23795 [Candidatus Methylacidiphilales bacterium]|nr:hypothetical protein [Candidatus Methylacidiphilales bacterium]